MVGVMLGDPREELALMVDARSVVRVVGVEVVVDRLIGVMIPGVHSTVGKRGGVMKAHSRVFLSPASSDKKGELVEGELVEVEYSDEAPQYLEPVGNDSASDLGKLRANVHEARAKLHHAKTRGKGVPEAQAAFEEANRAAGTAHYNQQKQRQQQRVGGDSPFGPRPTGDTRMFMPVKDYSSNDYDDSDDEADDEADDALEVKISALVSEMEQAVSDGRRNQGATRTTADSATRNRPAEEVAHRPEPRRRSRHHRDQGSVSGREETPRLRPRLEADTPSGCASSEE
jgi:hypothetical protein